MLKIKQVHHTLFFFTLPLATIVTLAPISIATAQEVSADGTVSTTVSSPDGKNFTINDGTTRGTNLFHSFKEFSVPTGGSANFNNAANIQNIISRVTGGSKSTIDGLIKANGAANLFLLNPAGILFGPNARLNIGGSFFGSTANSFIFENGFEFSATNLQAPPLLTINLPIGLRYGDNPGEIKVQGRGHDINFQEDIKNKKDDKIPSVRINNSIPGLEVESGKTLALVGGKVSLEGAILNSSSGRIEIGSVASNGVVSLASVQEGWELDYKSIGSFGDIKFSGRTLLDTKGVGSGSIAVTGKNINFTGESILLADTLGDKNGQQISIVGDEISVNESEIRSFTFSSGNAGQVKLFANKSILLENYGGAGTNTVGLGKAGEITVKADSIEVRDGSGLGSHSYGKGNAGRMEVQANNSLLIESKSGFGTSSNAEGDAGEINIVVGDFILRNQSGMTVNARSTGNGGKINITANSLRIENKTGLNSYTDKNSTGQGGEVNLNVAGPLVIQNEAGINSDTKGTGNAGKIIITANSLQISDSSGFTSTTGEGSTGNAGKIDITANSLQISNAGFSSEAKQGSTGQGGEINFDIAGPVVLQDGAYISNSTSGTGNAGKTSITANSLQISNAGFSSEAKQGSTGFGGEINFDVAGPVTVRKNSYINNSTSGTGNAGKIIMRANSLLIEDGGGINSSTQKGSTGLGGEINLDVGGPVVVRNSVGIDSNTSGRGNAGKISITANSLQISNRSGVTSTAKKDSTGQAGEIIVNVTGPLVLQNAGINSNTESTDKAGQVTVSAKSLEISNSGAISTSTTSSGNAGNLNVEAKTIILNNDGKLRVSSTGSGDAGTLNVVADTIRLNNQSSIDATTTSGKGGDLTLNVAKLLLLRRGSSISATAGTKDAPGNGGNITINTPKGIIVAFPNENSDITANSFSGSGGKITIKTQALFGIAPLSRQELERRLNTRDFTRLDPKNLPTSDITAISQQNPSFSGAVNINTQINDPTRGLFELPETVIDPAQQIAQNPCLRGGGEFIITGRGGFPTDPSKGFSSDNARVDLVKPVTSKTSHNSTSTTKKQQPSTNATDKPIVPARGWIFNEKGEVVLVAYDPTKTGVQRSSPTPVSNCAAR
ncbi:filamentous hemagglutinin N-terminal domain-containing protein [Brasilonema sp. UFV-L1]|uniref:two-partner secretion domain-containing protein n=1 Tax=Brasilonema sp. UFV-L1 TaxID=2234130 RepID=UPI00145E4A85|nr:filamentous hemagglutinin N-terminal domain-containing protein [Brasilonema sp. UFV-L1]NMG07226.1 hypothetical protein [Brasilonema sp. UFV-L1]